MEPNAFAVLLGPDAVPDLVRTTIRLIPGVDTVSAQADDEWRRLKDENDELRAEQEDDRRAWGRDSAAWELAVEGLREENARLQTERDGARRLGAYTAKRYVGLLEQLVPISAENERLRLLLGDNSLTTYDPETGCARCGCPTLVDDRCWGCKRRVVE